MKWKGLYFIVGISLVLLVQLYFLEQITREIQQNEKVITMIIVPSGNNNNNNKRRDNNIEKINLNKHNENNNGYLYEYNEIGNNYLIDINNGVNTEKYYLSPIDIDIAINYQQNNKMEKPIEINNNININNINNMNNNDKNHMEIYSINDRGNYHIRNYRWEIVIGIPTTVEKREARMRIRSTYLAYFHQTFCPYCDQPHDLPSVIVLFFIGKQKEVVLGSEIAKEQEMYGDIVELDIHENINEGKTFHTFEWIYNNLNTKYAMKADDDSFIIIPNLVSKLESFDHLIKSPQNIYYGFPCSMEEGHSKRRDFMCGMGYVIAEGLLEYIATDDFPRGAKSIRAEDMNTALWLDRLPRQVVRIGNRLQFHDHPQHNPSRVAFEYNCNDILIHPLKTASLWSLTSLFYLSCCDYNTTNNNNINNNNNIKDSIDVNNNNNNNNNNELKDDNNYGEEKEFCKNQPESQTKCSKGSGFICYPETVEVLGQWADSDIYFDDGRYVKHTLYSQYFGQKI